MELQADRRLRICMIVTYDLASPGGVKHHAVQLADALRRQGDEVVVVGPSSVPSDAPDVRTFGGVVNVPANGSDNMLGLLVSPRAIAKFFDANAFDVVHVHEPLQPSLSYWAVWLTRHVPHVATFHAFAEAEGRALRWARRAWGMTIFPWFQRAIAVSVPAGRYAAIAWRRPLAIIPNGVALDRFTAPDLRRDHGPVRLLFVGRLGDRRKGAHVLFEAYRGLVARRLPVTLDVVGELGAAESPPTLPGLRYHGPVGDAQLGALYRACDVFVAPSTGQESFGIVLLEAMASGKPIVCSDIEGYRRVAIPAGSSLVPPDDAGALEAALARVIEQGPELRAHQGEHNRRAAVAYDWQQLAGVVRAEYHAAIAEHARSTRLTCGISVPYGPADGGQQLKGIPGSTITGPALWAAAKLRVAQWDRRARAPEAVQVATLLAHCRAAAGTEFGRAHDLAHVRSYADFKARVPLRTYADFEPYLVRMRQGARDVLWPGLIPYYGQSSGTSETVAQHKFLPISTEQITWQQRAGFDVVARYLVMTGDRRFTKGYTLGLFPPAVITPDGPVGVASNPGLMLRHLPPVARLITLPRPPIRDIADYDHKLRAIAEAYLDHDVRALSGTTCWFSIFFDRVLDAARARGRDVATIGELWPNLSVLFGGGIHAEPYRDVIDRRVGRSLVLMDNYNATEGGIFAATDRLGDPGMQMIPDRGVFFEFVPRAEYGQANATRVPLWDVAPGVDYAVVLTTCSGLFGYAIGDFIRFSSVFPHRIEFAGRANGMLSLTQELTTALEIERAVAQAVAETSIDQPCAIVDFAASSEVGVDGSGKGRYVLFVEFDATPTDLGSFTSKVDRALCAQNRVYREHRARDVAILSPSLVALGKGASRKFMEALGQNSMQNKFPRIVDERRRDLLHALARNSATQPGEVT